MSSFDPALLKDLDFSAWTPIAFRSRKRAPIAEGEVDDEGHKRKPKYAWQPLPDSPLTLQAVQDGRDAGFLLQSLQYTDSTEFVVVKLSAAANDALRAPEVPKPKPLRAKPRLQVW
jgi:hypothetical protein